MSDNDVYGYDVMESTTGKVLKVTYGRDRGAAQSGQVILSDQSASAPSVTFTNDDNTGFWRIGSGSVGFSSDGTESVRFTSSGVQVTGLLTGTAVQQTTTDNTTGRLLTVGAFGIGGRGPLLSNLASTAGTTEPGLYRFSTAEGSTGGPTDVTAGSVAWMRRSSTSNEVQVLYIDASTSSYYPAGTVLTRYRTSSSWSSWRSMAGPIYTTGTISGYTYRLMKDPNGIQTITVNGYTTNAGSTPNETWPSTFTSAPAIQATAQSLAVARFAQATASTTAFQAVAFNSSGTQVSAAVDIVAIGTY